MQALRRFLHHPHSLSLLLALVWCVPIILRATVNEDAFITFRVIDNFVNGYGLRWNVVERVQVYTHPLWMLVNIPLYAIWSNAFLVSAFTGIVCSFLTAFLLLSVCSGWKSRVLVFALLYFSRGITEYSTTGLENSLSHLLVACMVWILMRRQQLRRPVYWLSLVVALAMLNRLDLVLLFVPVLLVLLAARKLPFNLREMVFGGLPLLAWLVFATIYYGSPLPNTYFAKLGGSFDHKYSWGMEYLYIYLRNDFVGSSLLLVALGLWCAEMVNLLLRTRVRWDVLALSTGALLSGYYVVHIGGDYMLARFFTPASVAGIGCIILRLREKFTRDEMLRSTVFMLMLYGCVHVLARPYYPCWFQRDKCAHWFANRVQDNARMTLPFHGVLSPAGKLRKMPDTDWAREGLRLRGQHHAFVSYRLGQTAYYGGPTLTIIDGWGLTDVFVAHSPIVRINAAGHGERNIPKGYVMTFSGDFSMLDLKLVPYVQFVHSITQGPVWSMQRWRNILLLNSGWLRRELQAYADGKDGI